MNDDYVASIVTINCIGTLTNMDINRKMPERASHSRTDELLEAILGQLIRLNKRLDDGI